MSDNTPTPTPEWISNLPEPLQDAPFISKAANPEEAMNKLAHAAKLVGTSIRIPDSSATEADLSAFYDKLTQVEGVARLPLSDDREGQDALLSKLGKPNEYTEYKLPELDDFEWDDTAGTTLRKYALEAGLTTRQFNDLATQLAQQEKEADTASRQAVEDNQRALRQDWGDTLEEREDLIRGWLDKSDAPESMTELLNDRELPLDTMNWLLAVAKQFKGDVTPITRHGQGPETAMAPSEAREKIPQVIKDMTGMRESDPRYRDLQKKLLDLHRLANPSDAA